MIRTTAAPADVRLNRIKDFVRQANFNRDPHNVEFGLQVSDRCVTTTRLAGSFGVNCLATGLIFFVSVSSIRSCASSYES